MNHKIERINELVKKLNEASKAYYQDASEIMTNYENQTVTTLGELTPQWWIK
jgi:hypothetical protein